VLETVAAIAGPYLVTLPAAPGEATPPDEFLPVIGASMAGVVEMLRVFAQQDETILLSGPTGVGKSRLARWCHERSPRRGQRFETLDLATVPDDLQMAELFGWKKGAFTGALKDTPGCIARAEGGTLFIDEIDKLSLKTQAGLLRVLEERCYRPLGDDRGERRADVRFVIGTNANLQALVREGRFRADLYFRINVLPVRVPPLRERQDEITQWASYMLNQRRKNGRAELRADAEEVLRQHAWPGNLRQLENIVRRAYALSLIEHGEARGDPGKTVPELFQLTAVAFVAEAERRQRVGETLEFDLTDALRGFVLAVAAERLGSKEKAFRLAGKEKMIADRNHQKAWKREMDRVSALYRAFDVGRPPFASIDDDGDG
jgi:transcriptional regulator with GAF, ATPase, and Fis domain